MGVLDTVLVGMLHNRPLLPFHQVLHLHLCLRLALSQSSNKAAPTRTRSKYLEEIVQSSLA